MKHVQDPSTNAKNSQKQGITVELVGGLGNQLFIYATGYELSQQLDCPLFLDVTWFQGKVSRTLELHQSAIEGSFTYTSPALRTLTSRLRQLGLPKRQLAWGTFTESGFQFDKSIANVPIGTSLRGYFQSWKYFARSAENIRSQIRTLSSTSEWYLEKIEEFSNQDDWLAIHVRRGDYLNAGTREFHGIMDERYYRNAIKIIDSNSGIMPIKVFSDDIKAAKSLFAGNQSRFEFINSPPESSSLESLLLMSRGSGIITANSSFSWWAAWLGQTPSRQVVVPSPWFRGAEISTVDLFLGDWAVASSSLS